MFAKTNTKLTQSAVIKQLTKSAIPLINAIKAENTLLEKGKISSLESACEKKVQCLQHFNDAQYGLEEFVRFSPINKNDPLLAKLKEVFLELEKVNQRNDVLLRANIEASNKIIEFYKASQTSRIAKNYGYNNQGNIVASKNLEKVMPSISLNDKI